MSPGLMEFFALIIVRQGCAKVPSSESLPETETKYMLPERTVNGNALLALPSTVITISPDVTWDPGCTTTMSIVRGALSSPQTTYLATSLPPIVTVEVPRSAPKPCP